MMLLLSPLGWVYYFTLLIMPLTFIWYSIKQSRPTLIYSVFWTCCLFLINMPTPYTQERYMGFLMYKLSFYSIYFYGLLMSLYLLLNLPSQRNNKTLNVESLSELLLAVKCSLGLGLFGCD